MSFDRIKDFIEDGDVVVLYLGPNNMHSLEVKEKILNKKNEKVDNVFQTIYGALKVFSLVGKKYGDKVELSRGWGYILQPTPELWTLTLPHRTQIIYSPDISLIIHLMELKPGDIVVETGTGSGSLSHSLIRTVRPYGHLYTFDFHEQRVSAARAEFDRHGLDKFVTLEHRDICLEGFGDQLRNKVDGIFLDLPHPWLVIERASDTLKKSGGKLCSFSPCIEQVQRTYLKLLSQGFVEINTYECLQKEMNVQYKNVSTMNLECLKYKHLNIEATQGNENQKREKQEKLLTVVHPHSLPGHTGFVTIATLPPFYARKVRLNLSEYS